MNPQEYAWLRLVCDEFSCKCKKINAKEKQTHV